MAWLSSRKIVEPTWKSDPVVAGAEVTPASLLDHERGPAARRHAMDALEMARHVTLVGKTARERRVDQRCAPPDQRARPVEAPHDQISIGAGAQAGAKMPRDGVPRQPRKRFELRRGDARLDIGVEQVARLADGAPVQRRQLSSRDRQVDRGEGLREVENDLVAVQILQLPVELVEGRHDRGGEVSVVRHRLAHEWKGARLTQGVANRAGFDIEYPVA